MSGINGADVDDLAKAQSERLARKVAEREAVPAANDGGGAPVIDAASAQAEQQTVQGVAKAKIFELHVEMFNDGSFNVATDFRNADMVLNCVSGTIQSLVKMQTEMHLKAAIARAEATIPKGTQPMWHRVRGAMRAAVGLKS